MPWLWLWKRAANKLVIKDWRSICEPVQTVKTPWESARGPKPFRAPIVPGGVYGGDWAIFAAENPIFQSKNRFLAVFAPENP